MWNVLKSLDFDEIMNFILILLKAAKFFKFWREFFGARIALIEGMSIFQASGHLKIRRIIVLWMGIVLMQASIISAIAG